jgi:hypothetical protein
MPYCEHLENITHDAKKCEIEVDLCDNVLECACCAFFLEKYKQVVVDEIIDELNNLPREITRVKIPLLPVPDNKSYYSFNGIETIVFNFFRTNNLKQKQELEKQKSYLKIYYEKNSLFNLPIIQIEVIFFGKLHSKTIDSFWKTLKAEILFFTGSVGDIDVINVTSKEQLSDLLRMPLLIGYPEFKLNGALFEHKFSLEQIDEMNYLHSMKVITLNMGEVINNKTLDLFEYQREFIKQKRLKSNRYSDGLDNDEINELIQAIFPSEDNIEREDMFNDLPF